MKRTTLQAALLLSMSAGTLAAIPSAGATSVTDPDGYVAQGVSETLKMNRALVEGWKTSNPNAGAPTARWTEPRLKGNADQIATYKQGTNGAYCISVAEPFFGMIYGVTDTDSTPTDLAKIQTRECAALGDSIKASLDGIDPGERRNRCRNPPNRHQDHPHIKMDTKVEDWRL